MDDVRRVRRMMKVAASVAVVGAVLSVTLRAPVLVALFAVGVGFAGVVYWLAPRYPAFFETADDTDAGGRRRLRASLFDLAVFCLATAGLAYGWTSLGWTDASVLTATPDGTTATLLAALVGVFLGSAVPVLAEREVAFHSFRGPVQGETAGQVLRVAAVLVLLLAAPGALLGFLGAYVVGRLGVLVWWQAAGS